MDESSIEARVPTREESAVPTGERRELTGTAATAAWLDELCTRYAGDVRWTAPRRGLVVVGRGPVIAHLRREFAAMAEPGVCVLRYCGGQARSFHEFTIRFRLLAPGIEGVGLPPGAQVELERLRVLTHDAEGLVTAETCIETWTALAPAGPAA